MSRAPGTICAAVLVVTIGRADPATSTQAGAQPKHDGFAARVAALSEPGGYFDTDNLISNERSYLHVVPDFAARRLSGGAYIGVGPDQNFSYIAHLRPSIAIIVDIRRDNLLLHLLFKALFGLARTRAEYLALLAGRPPPQPMTGWESRSIEAIVEYIERARPVSAAGLDAARARITDTIETFGVPLSAADYAAIDRFHRRFIADGLSLQFNSAGRAPQVDYPTYRDLLLETDRLGARRSFLANEDAFQFVKSLQARDLVIPVVGDISGPKALMAVGRFLADRRERLSVFYVSNVEFYLFRDGRFGRFVENLRHIPYADGGVLIRSVFAGGATRPPPGYNSTSLTHEIRDLVDGFAQGRFRQYWELTVGRQTR
jgi:hypothetical protein